MFSIIIPAFNPGNRIYQLLNLLLDLKNYYELEIIVIDDGSDFINKTKMDECVNRGVIYKRFENKGVSIARNRGIELAHGDYITFFDADDLVDIKALGEIMSKIEMSEQEIDIFMFAYSMIDGSKCTKIIPNYKVGLYSGELLNELKRKLIDIKFSKNYSSSYIGGKVYQYFVSKRLFSVGALRFYEKQNYAEDLCYCIMMFDLANSIYVFHDVVYLYYVNEGSASHKYRPDLWNEWYSVYKYVDKYIDDVTLKNRLIYWAAKKSVRHIVSYEHNYSVLSDKVASIIHNSELKTAMKNLNFDNWTFNERMENFFIGQGRICILVCFEWLICKLKS